MAACEKNGHFPRGAVKVEELRIKASFAFYLAVTSSCFLLSAAHCFVLRNMVIQEPFHCSLIYTLNIYSNLSIILKI